jgi:hypothetical protein
MNQQMAPARADLPRYIGHFYLDDGNKKNGNSLKLQRESAA